MLLNASSGFTRCQVQENAFEIRTDRFDAARIDTGLSQVCRDLLARVPWVTLYVNEGNRAAIALYDALGFSKVTDWRTTVVWRD